ncbi:MAG: redoxin domain-containing protein [Planctomycetales bacterium]|nr:redoxin domain-containing protein [Planctomycetales bacterium]
MSFQIAALRQLPPWAAVGVVLLLSTLAGRLLRQSSPSVRQPESGPLRPVQALAESVPMPHDGVEAEGKLLYVTYCAKCHGADGRGEPDAVLRLKPPPRDFAARPWRFEPSTTSIRRVVREGIPGTAMPGAAAFTMAQLDAVTHYVMQLATASDRFLQPAAPATAPLLELRGPTGRATHLSDFRGRPVLIHFWGVDCVSCVRELPALHRLGQDFESLVVLNVCLDVADSEQACRTAPDQFRSTVYVDATGLARHRYHVQSLPTCWLVNSSGQLVARSVGAVPWDNSEVRQQLRALLQ